MSCTFISHISRTWCHANDVPWFTYPNNWNSLLVLRIDGIFSGQVCWISCSHVASFFQGKLLQDCHGAPTSLVEPDGNSLPRLLVKSEILCFWYLRLGLDRQIDLEYIWRCPKMVVPYLLYRRIFPSKPSSYWGYPVVTMETPQICPCWPISTSSRAVIWRPSLHPYTCMYTFVILHTYIRTYVTIYI